MNDLSRLEYEEYAGKMPSCDLIGPPVRDGDGYVHLHHTLLWKVWQAARSTPVTLPPLLDLEGRTGRSFIIAGAHNSAIAMCSMAITGAGYTTVCSHLLENEESP